ncbi:MAG TPA: hypothetical protein VIU61_07125 [Kofleriaceae bacterium]
MSSSSELSDSRTAWIVPPIGHPLASSSIARNAIVEFDTDVGGSPT